MAGLVEEIQAAAIDPGSSVAELLRRVKLAAAKLQLQDAIEWVNHELSGYRGVADKDVPTYRHLSGRVVEYDDRRGLVPAHGDSRTLAALSYKVVKDSISSIEDLAKKDGKTVSLEIDADFADMLQRYEETAGRLFYVNFGTNALVTIVESVRNLVLDWAIALERQGILGEGISFSMAEKEKAAVAGMTIHIGNLDGGIHQAIVAGDGNKTLVSATDNSVNSTTNVFADLSTAIEGGVSNGADKAQMLALVEQLKATQGTPEYKLPFAKLMDYAANYATVLGPFIPALSQILTS